MVTYLAVTPSKKFGGLLILAIRSNKKDLNLAITNHLKKYPHRKVYSFKYIETLTSEMTSFQVNSNVEAIPQLLGNRD